MEKKYNKYSVEDFACDLNFIKWVKKGTDAKKWETLQNENPHFSNKIETAKKIITALHTPETYVGQDETYAVWKNVELFYKLHHQTNRKKRFIKFAQYAAIFLLALSIGAIIPIIYFTQNNHREYRAFELATSNKPEAKLILAGGEEIILKEKQSELQFDTSGRQIRIDQDSVINYREKIEQNSMAQVIVPFGMRSDICLSDGTKVWLNAGSTLTFPQKFTGKTRKVFLKGEAYFDVTKNTECPFVVSSDNLNVRVLGTEFNIRDDEYDNESAEVVLIEGAVSLRGKGMFSLLRDELRLKPNQKATYSKSDKKTTVESGVKVEYYTSWKEGLLEFNKESILTVFNRLSRFYNVRFISEKSVGLNRQFTGKLDLEKTLDEVLKIMSDAAPITCRIEGNKIFVNSK